MTKDDLDSLVDLLPLELTALPREERRTRLQERFTEGVVVLRGSHVVAAVWYADAVNATQPWYSVVAPHVVAPARLTAGLFAVPDEKGAAWLAAKHGNDWLATRQVRTVVSWIRANNRPSILITRMLGGKLVARQHIHRWFGMTRQVIVAAADRSAFAADGS